MFKEKIKLQTKKLHLVPSDEVLAGLEKDAAIIYGQMDLLKSVDVSNVRPMVRVDETPISFLREDVVNELHFTLDQKDVLENARSTKGEFIAVRKAGKND